MKASLTSIRILFLTLFFVIVFLAVSWAGDPVSVRMAYLQNDIHHLAFWVAEEEDIFADEGVIIDTVGAFRAGPEIMSAFASGDLDMAYVGQSPATVGFANKAADVVVVAQVNTEGTAIVIKKQDAANFESLQDLAGKTIAIPGHATVQEAILLKGLKKVGLSRKEIHLMVLKPPDMIGSLRTGQIDAFIAWEPYPAKAITSGVGKMLAASKKLWPEHPCCVLVVEKSFMKAHPRIVERTIQAHAKATQYVCHHPDKAAQIAVKYTGMDELTIRKAMQNVHFTTELNIEDAKEYVNFLSELGYIQKQDPEAFIRNFIRLDLLPSEIR
ncbi:NitT/TauT family transport system substrate-binding protein [Desulfosalsimonas propionicica]|uniref:NitT/TauT family transport system substrate-binding protein n=1 Tax=Desulfosalsimonas propionicica TaxID=332175 RepID=A0A7W0HLX9_9BACT|nr:ABC transporter substrate-binding protein [Desulfosalsimonas propionicica]MBA2882785.1 NitT/TauT family transport system substrate-binding protein [Desulfosalsimonas propionicica]